MKRKIAYIFTTAVISLVAFCIGKFTDRESISTLNNPTTQYLGKYRSLLPGSYKVLLLYTAHFCLCALYK